MYIAFDPGPVTGWCKFNNRGHELEMGQLTLEQLPTALESWPTVAIVKVLYEPWVFIPKKMKAQIGRQDKAKIPTIKAMGVIESWCIRHGLEFEQVKPDMLLAAQKWTQVKIPSDHSVSHQVVAFLHGARWLIDNDLRLTALEIESARKQEERASTGNPGQVNGGSGSDA